MKKYMRMLSLLLAVILSVTSFTACGDEQNELDSLNPTPLLRSVGSPIPEAEEFFEALPAGVSVRYAEEYLFATAGTYELTLILTDANGEEVTKTAQFTLVLDQTPPTIHGVKDILAYIGNGVSYKSGITVTDNCDTYVELVVDSSAVDLTKEGSYPIRYTATDAAGNIAEVSATVHVYEMEITEAMLNEKLDAVIASIIEPSMTKEEMCRKIYYYVYDNVYYSSKSDKSSWVRAAYHALDKRQGDCFTYYALAKAFFERLGIENMCIQRTPAASERMKETHFWNYVNIGDMNAPMWYHFDATHLNDVSHTRRLVLITEEQLQNYNFSRSEKYGETGDFYAYDHTGYPTPATKKITNLP